MLPLSIAWISTMQLPCAHLQYFWAEPGYNSYGVAHVAVVQLLICSKRRKPARHLALTAF
jgi:hypothetical protein